MICRRLPRHCCCWVMRGAWQVMPVGPRPRMRSSKAGRRSDPRTLAYYFAKRGQHLDVAKELIDEERRGRADPYTLDVQAWVLFRLGQAAEARRIIDGPGVLGLGLRDARVLYHAAAIHAATGDKEGAQRLAADAVRRNPQFDADDAAAAPRPCWSPGRPDASTANRAADCATDRICAGHGDGIGAMMRVRRCRRPPRPASICA